MLSEAKHVSLLLCKQQLRFFRCAQNDRLPVFFRSLLDTMGRLLSRTESFLSSLQERFTKFCEAHKNEPLPSREGGEPAWMPKALHKRKDRFSRIWKRSGAGRDP